MSTSKRQRGKLMRLTPEQEAMLPVWAEKWTAIGLSCEPLDVPKAKAAVRLAYKTAGLKPPERWLVCDGPISAALAATLVRGNKPSVGASVGDSVRDSVRASVGASVWASVGASVWDSVRDSVWASVGASVWASVGASVWDSVRASVGASVWDSVRASVGASVRDSVYGSHDAHWLGFYSFFLHVCGMHEPKPLIGLMRLARCCGWWSPYSNLAVLQHRHCELHRDDAGRLHNESGMAVRYRDGWGVWAINGVRVDEQTVMRPRTQTVEMILGQSNEEIRRVRAERYGWERLLNKAGASVVDSRRNDIEATREVLSRLDKTGDLLLLTHCPSTGRRYALQVPGDEGIETCQQAQRWLMGGAAEALGLNPARLSCVGAT